MGSQQRSPQPAQPQSGAYTDAARVLWPEAKAIVSQWESAVSVNDFIWVLVYTGLRISDVGLFT